MKISQTKLPGLVIIEPQVFGDHRGWFLEAWSNERYKQAGIEKDFVQDNASFSPKGILRGLHCQNPGAQGKLVQVLSGEIFDVAVDVRVGSPTFAQWYGNRLSADNHRQMYIPAGFAHGFCVLSETAIFSYKCTEYFSPSTEFGIIWNDPDIGIDWPIKEPTLSQKDSTYPKLADINPKELPQYEAGK